MRIGADAFDRQHTEIRLLDSDGIDGTEFRTEGLVSVRRRRIALSDGVAHAKFTRIRAEVIEWQYQNSAIGFGRK